LEVLILNDLGVNIIMWIGLRVRAKNQEPGWVTEILGLKTKKRQPGCRIPNANILNVTIHQDESFVKKKEGGTTQNQRGRVWISGRNG
jgi:hypothetical protein